jgi:hypothetical protein
VIAWIVLGWVLASATWLAVEWVRARSRQRIAASRHAAWRTMVSELVFGSAAQHSRESRGAR